MIQKFEHLPTSVKAIKFDGTDDCKEEIKKFTKGNHIFELHGENLKIGDYIVESYTVLGSFYAVEAELFEPYHKLVE